MSLRQTVRGMVRSHSPSRRAARRHPGRQRRKPLAIERLEGRLSLSHTYLLVTDGPRQNQRRSYTVF
jgi:hypothetical protein